MNKLQRKYNATRSLLQHASGLMSPELYQENKERLDELKRRLHVESIHRDRRDKWSELEAM